MSEIMVMIPIDLVQGATSLDAQGISEYLSKAVEAHANIPRLQAIIDERTQKVKDIGAYLENLADQPADSMKRAKDMRQLIQDCKNYGG